MSDGWRELAGTDGGVEGDESDEDAEHGDGERNDDVADSECPLVHDRIPFRCCSADGGADCLETAVAFFQASAGHFSMESRNCRSFSSASCLSLLHSGSLVSSTSRSSA